MTAQGAVRLAIKTGAPLLPMSVTRDKAKFIVTFHAPIALHVTGERQADVLSGVKQRRWPKSLYI